MAAQEDQHDETSLVSMSELLHQIHTNKKHFERHESPKKRFFEWLGPSDSMRSSKSAPELQVRSPGSSTGSARIRLSEILPALSAPTGVPTVLPPVRELDVDPDTFLFLCCPFPVITLQAIRRKITTCFRNLLWPRPPLPCVTTTCGPIFHVRSCEFHPLAGALPYKMPIRRCISLPSGKVQRTVSLQARRCSSSSASSSSSSSS